MDKDVVKSENFAASIKLPEGHELLIGELPPGTILEVATWQGIGRPDETTNRFLMSADGPGLGRKSVEQPAAPAAIETPVAPVPVSEPAIPEAPVNSVQESAPEVVDQTPPATASLVSSMPSAAPFLGVRSFGESVSEKKFDKPKTKIKTKKIKEPKGSRKNWAKSGRTTFFTVAVIALFSVGLNALGISVAVPTTGAKTFFGSSTTSLVFYMRSTEPTLGVPTIARAEFRGKRQVYYGVSSGFSESQIQIATSAGQILVATNSIAGRGFLAIPLLGWVVKPLLN
jgi:hypothetical protein